jgi:hypothetical protein
MLLLLQELMANLLLGMQVAAHACWQKGWVMLLFLLQLLALLAQWSVHWWPSC